jgi:hypothetical protein
MYNVKGYSPVNTELCNYVLAHVLNSSCMSNRYYAPVGVQDLCSPGFTSVYGLHQQGRREIS